MDVNKTGAESRRASSAVRPRKRGKMLEKSFCVRERECGKTGVKLFAFSESPVAEQLSPLAALELGVGQGHRQLQRVQVVYMQSLER